jgi:hypothetical protein
MCVCVRARVLVQLAFHVTALIMLNIHSGELNDKIKEDMYILIKGTFFLTIDLPWTAYGIGMQVRTDDKLEPLGKHADVKS